MTNTDRPAGKVYHGRNIKRFRGLPGIKQEALTLELDDDWSQKKVSRLEENERVEKEVLEQVAKILKVPVEAIRNFDEEMAIHNIQNNYDGAVVNSGPAINYKCNFNPLDKWAEEVAENRRLYERLLQVEKEKIEMLEKMMTAYSRDKLG